MLTIAGNQNRTDSAALAIFNGNLMQKRSADREEKSESLSMSGAALGRDSFVRSKKIMEV